jgi:hypothetical protein
MEKYTPQLGYFDVINACAQPGCPICQLGQKVINDYLDMVLYESVADPKTRDQLRASLGYCNTHAWWLSNVGKGNTLGIAIIYQDLLEVLNTILPQMPNRKPLSIFQRVFRLFQRKKPLKPHEYRVQHVQQSCPACVLRHETETNVLKIMMAALAKKDEQMQAALKKSHGICLPHVTQAMEVTQDKAAIQLLVTITTATIGEIREELAELIRKHDYRFQHEPMGSEKESWKRAINLLVGIDAQIKTGEKRKK